MKRWANLIDSTLTLIVEQEDQPILEGIWIDITDKNVGPGYSYNEGVFTEPLPVTQPAVITKIALLNRMTDAEFIGIINAAKTDAEVELWKTRFDLATTIDLNDGSKVVAGFPMLVAKGLLTEARSAEILTLTIQPNERS
jgi:hypothetical protein